MDLQTVIVSLLSHSTDILLVIMILLVGWFGDSRRISLCQCERCHKKRHQDAQETTA
jgi:hypothetical protein